MSGEEGEYELVYDQGSGIPSPTAWLWGQAFRFALSIVIVLILIWLIGKIPLIGPPFAHGIRRALGWALNATGVIVCAG